MYDRFTHKSRTSRGKIRQDIRQQVFARDGYQCQFCGAALPPEQLTIDHLIPLARAGLDEITNYVACCGPCNQRKADMPLEVFAQQIQVPIESLPVHGDPIINNESIPVQLRLLRKRIFDRMRVEDLRISGTSAQKKLEKQYRREFWATAEGKLLEEAFPSLPGHARIMLPEIQAIANSERDFFLLIELAKSASTRNLIGSVLRKGDDIGIQVVRLAERQRDSALQKRLGQALERFRKVMIQRADKPDRPTQQ